MSQWSVAVGNKKSDRPFFERGAFRPDMEFNLQRSLGLYEPVGTHWRAQVLTGAGVDEEQVGSTQRNWSYCARGYSA